jgi:glycosyltransferase involved in cell wall biosynthesis
MIKTSGFTFIHNALDGGYPIAEAIHAIQTYVDEVVVVDCASTDGTGELLERLADTPIYDIFGRNKTIPLRIIGGKWGSQAGETLRQAHSKYIECDGDVIVHFEADEVYSDRLIRSVVSYIKAGRPDDCHLSVMRLQLEQNFQRCRWYPEPVHRIFPRLSGARKEGHTTDQHERSFLLTEKSGYLWDITNCFRDNWFNRVEAQAKLRGEQPNYLMVGHHCNWQVNLSENDARQRVYSSKHWTWTRTPFNIPEILIPLVGQVKYEPSA